MPSADELRLAGNQAFASKDLDTALQLYTSAISARRAADADPNAAGPNAPPPPPGGGPACSEPAPLSTHLCNRSLVLSAMSSYPLAIADARECVRLTGGRSAKGWFRLVKGYCGARLFGEALEALEEALATRQRPVRQIGEEAEPEDTHRGEREEMEKLRGNVQKHKKAHDKKVLSGEYNVVVKSVRTDGRKPSVREFDFESELGQGNFSRIVSARHKTTGERFAVKIIEKKQVEQLQRRHPNVHNEIQMEKRVLAKLRHPLVVALHHTFQDYNALYFLMDYCEGAEMWTTIMFGSKLVGCHESLARFYMGELVEVLEYLHGQGVVHRDLKPENLMIDVEGHLKLIDFGTAKDMVSTDLNGPEFVGTPEFMSPETVKSKPADYSTDLWSFGVVMWQMLLGTTPFKAPSPYLGFLKIKRGQLVRHPALDDDAWDFISRLVVVDRSKRIGFAADNEVPNYAEIRSHPYFKGGLQPPKPPLHAEAPERVPSLSDLCIRACAELAVDSSLNLDAEEPGSGGSSDMLRLAPRDRARVMHFLDRMEKLGEPRVLRRFYRTALEAKFGRVRPMTRDFLGLTSELENQFTEPIDFVHISEVTEKPLLTTIVKTINRKRPKFVVVTGKLSEESLRVVAKISETISVVIADGTDFFSFYCGGCQGIVLNGELLVDPSVDPKKSEEQSKFASQELEQSRMCQHHTFVITDIDPRKLPETFTEKVAKSRVCGIVGTSGAIGTEADYEGEFVVGKGAREGGEDKKVTEPKEETAMQEEGVYPKAEEDREGSDVDSDGYNLVDDDSRVKILARGFSTVFTLQEERAWKAFSLPIA
ncbi:hypothetical protein TeGR_g14161 [Tetraparma gracilis]|uniref:Protein kinase domain-containing protein n=1 Tax=Tetraparma gracilis TaxID=2962635 RepID=A0ABQ6MT02_9STRA|nr:hypothetical protein TeGR_g14161 [Tetraparma gracilis]